MELNRNKLIFFIICWILVFWLVFLFIISKMWWDTTKPTTTTTKNELVIWAVFPNMKPSSELVANFKKAYPQYAGKSIKIENFSDYETYTYTLESAFASDMGPDIFIMNNNETSIFSDMTLGINPEVINVSDFRRNYKTVLTDDLIVTLENGQEFLMWVPVGYETLGVFYNKRYVKVSDLTTISSLNSAISKLKARYQTSVPLGIGNGTTVKFSSDIATQFMILEDGGRSLETLTQSQIQTGILAYLNYGYKDIQNNYNSKYQILKDKNTDASYLFANNDSFMVVWYPRFIHDIEQAGGIPLNFLFVEPFPHYTPASGKTLINYNYFVLNKNSQQIPAAESFLAYLFSESGQRDFFAIYPFYLPAYLPLETEMDTMKIHDKYNIKIKDFYDDTSELTSFDKGIKNVYDRDLPAILDLGENYSRSFSHFKRKLDCMTSKALNFTNISRACE